MQMKKCRKCGRLLPLTEEYWTHNQRFGCGFESRCKECNRPDRLYRKWIDMKSRCLNPNSCNYMHYGGRGIVICDEWIGKEGFENFRTWAMSNGYTEGLSIDRIDRDGSYCPDNCRWTTRRVQNINKRPSSPNTSGYVGIKKHSSGKGWYGSVKVENVDCYTGYSENLLEAVRMRNEYILSRGLENELNEVADV